jgi:hypothetical protein
MMSYLSREHGVLTHMSKAMMLYSLQAHLVSTPSAWISPRLLWRSRICKFDQGIRGWLVTERLGLVDSSRMSRIFPWAKLLLRLATSLTIMSPTRNALTWCMTIRAPPSFHPVTGYPPSDHTPGFLSLSHR